MKCQIFKQHLLYLFSPCIMTLQTKDFLKICKGNNMLKNSHS